ncbi:hypothetical protein CPB83DRAFT_739751, partial [Crepidotus variabilis]
STAPQWFLASYNSFNSPPLGKPWRTMLREWMVFESASGYEEVARTKSKGRPEVVKQWIDRGRSTTWRPIIKNIKTYEKQYTQWWTSLQPAWRVTNNSIDKSLTDGDWEPLRLPGLNGLHSAIAGLFYWGIA